MGLRLGLLFLLVACGPEEKAQREVSQGTYPTEYAAALCPIQLECMDTDVTMEECLELNESSVRGKLERNCFNKDVAIECLDTLDELSCADFDNNEWSMCGDVDDCSEV